MQDNSDVSDFEPHLLQEPVQLKIEDIRIPNKLEKKVEPSKVQ